MTERLGVTRLQNDRELACKPTYRARNVLIRQNLFPAVAFEIHQHTFPTAPSLYREAKRGKQQIVHFRMVSTVCLLQQLFGFLRRPANGHEPAVLQLGSALFKIFRKRLIGQLLDMLPILSLAFHRRTVRIISELFRPRLE
ncbi:hypothetical protein D3C74_222330 [compost metagenome]